MAYASTNALNLGELGTFEMAPFSIQASMNSFFVYGLMGVEPARTRRDERGGQTGQGEMGDGTGGLSYRYGVVPERQSYLIMPSPVVQVGPIPRDWWRCRARGALKVSKYYIYNRTGTTYLHYGKY